jgi:hypothetical protein
VGVMIVMGKGWHLTTESEPMPAEEAERMVRANRERWPAWSWWTVWV